MTDRMVEPIPKASAGFVMPKRRQGLRAVGRKGRQRQNAWGKVIAVLKARGQFGCEACEVHHLVECNGLWEHTHHILPRGRGGKDTVANALPVSSRHHDWIHDHPDLAERLGLVSESRTNSEEETPT